MGDLRFVEWMVVATAVLTALLVALTAILKVLRALRWSVYKRYYRCIEPTLENCLTTGEGGQDLERLRSWEKDRFLSPLIVKRMALLRGAERDALVGLAARLGLVDRYLANLKSRRRWHRARAAENLGHFGGERAVEPLGVLLSDEDETVRAVAARALARIGTESAAESLARTLDSPSELTRLRAAENLERLGNLAVKMLSGLLLELTDRGAVMAAQVLGNLRARTARPALRSVLLYTWDGDVRAQATLALGKIGDPEDIPPILEGARSLLWPVRAQAANALGLIGEISTIPTLKELAADREWWVRLSACKALANMGPSGEKTLIEILGGDDRYARDRAAAILETHGIIRRMVRNLTKPGKKGERAKVLVQAVIRSGSTRYLRGLLKTLPDDERRALEELLEEHAENDPASTAPGTPAMNGTEAIDDDV